MRRSPASPRPISAATAGNFVASINWGDGTPSSGGFILANGTTGYDVLGNHTYAHPGTYPVNVTLTDLGSNGSTVVGGTTINVVSQGLVNSSPDPIASTAAVAAAALTAQGVPIRGLDGIPLAPGAADVLVATFIDAGTIGSPSDYSASIAWGDGSTSAATRITSSGTANGTVFSVFGNHTYATVGSFPVVVTITKAPFAVPSPGTPAAPPGAQAIAASTATIADAPLSAAPTQPTVNATEGVFFSGPVGTFTDLNPSAAIAEFKAIIDWGDGSPQSAGTIAAVTSGGTTVYQVSGSHTYADSIPLGKPGSGVPGPQNGTYPITVYVTDIGGAAVNLTNTASVADVALTLAGQLDPASDSGVSNTDGITNVTQPRFFGTTSERDAKVFVYATPTGSVTRTLLGQTESDSNGAWSLTSGIALADGSYTISAQAIDDSNHTLSNVTTVTQTLVIDTVGPKVTDVFFDRINGQVQPTFQDFGGVANGGVGLNQLTLVDANNYRFRLLYSPFNPKHVPKFLVTSIAVNPGTNSGPQARDGRDQQGPLPPRRPLPVHGPLGEPVEPDRDPGHRRQRAGRRVLQLLPLGQQPRGRRLRGRGRLAAPPDLRTPDGHRPGHAGQPPGHARDRHLHPDVPPGQDAERPGRGEAVEPRCARGRRPRGPADGRPACPPRRPIRSPRGTTAELSRRQTRRSGFPA